LKYLKCQNYMLSCWQQSELCVFAYRLLVVFWARQLCVVFVTGANQYWLESFSRAFSPRHSF